MTDGPGRYSGSALPMTCTKRCGPPGPPQLVNTFVNRSSTLDDHSVLDTGWARLRGAQ
jgi:hypothetical protein